MQQQYTVWRIIHPNSSSTCGLVASQKDSMQKIYTFPLCRASAFLFCNSPFTNGPTTRRSRNLRACDKSAAAFFRSSADGSCKHGNPGGWKHWLQSYSISTPSRNTRLNKSFARLGLTLLSISWNIFCTLKLILKTIQRSSCLRQELCSLLSKVRRWLLQTWKPWLWLKVLAAMLLPLGLPSRP